MYPGISFFKKIVFKTIILIVFFNQQLLAQGSSTSITGTIMDEQGNALMNANVVAVHRPTRTPYKAVTEEHGIYKLTNLKAGGPYVIAVTHIGFQMLKDNDIYLTPGQEIQLDFQLSTEAVKIAPIRVRRPAPRGKIRAVNSLAAGMSSAIPQTEVKQLPSIIRSVTDILRLDPRSDGNYSFGGRNWFYNTISVDHMPLNNQFGLGHPVAGGQSGAELIPFESIENVQIALTPFNVKRSGFTGADINLITKTGDNEVRAAAYGFLRNEGLQGNTVSGDKVFADPDLAFNQWGFSASGPLAQDKLFFLVNGELERRRDPGTNFTALRGAQAFGVSRVEAAIMDSIRTRMQSVYGYDPGEFEDYSLRTENEKLLVKLDWLINENMDASFMWNRLKGRKESLPNATLFSFNGTGRGPSANSLPFRKSGYEQNNQLNSWAVRLNNKSDSGSWTNQFLFSFNRFRDFRDPFSEDFPTIEIVENGLTYTTFGHEPFSIKNEVDQDVWQITDNFTLTSGKHRFTMGASLEVYSFFHSSNVFYHGNFNLPFSNGGTTFLSLDEFFAATDDSQGDPAINFRQLINTEPFKAKDVDLGQFSIYGQDEYPVSDRLNISYGMRIDFPLYFTNSLDNPFSKSLSALDENDNPEVIDQSQLPGTTPLISPRVGINYDLRGDGLTTLRAGTGIYAGKVPFAWIGDAILNPGLNPNQPEHFQTSAVNAVDDDFKWPQIWNTSASVEHQFAGGYLGIFELLFGKDIYSVYVRNADLGEPVGNLPDGRPYYGGAGFNKLNSESLVSDINVLDNTGKGYNLNLSMQLQKTYSFGLNTNLFYNFNHSESAYKLNESLNLLWQENPVQGDPNQPSLGNSEFGTQHRLVGMATYSQNWSPTMTTHFGLFLEVGQGNPYRGLGSGNRYSFTYAGDVNGDGSPANDLIHIPRNSNEIFFSETDADGNFFGTVEDQWVALNAFISQDSYLSENRGNISQRFGLFNPWFTSLDLRILQDITFNDTQGRKHTFQFNFDVLNLLNLFSSDWGVRETINPSALNPLRLVRFNDESAPVFNFIGPDKTFIDDTSIFSRWRIQLGLKYLFN